MWLVCFNPALSSRLADGELKDSIRGLAVISPTAFPATLQALPPWTGAPCSRFCVHGLNTTFFQCFHYRSTPYVQERKKEGLRPSSSTHVRKNANMGHPSRGIGLVRRREICRPTNA